MYDFNDFVTIVMDAAFDHRADEGVEKRERIKVPKAVEFEQRYMECPKCGRTWATYEQRKKNRKRYHYAMNVYARAAARVDMYTYNGIYSN